MEPQSACWWARPVLTSINLESAYISIAVLTSLSLWPFATLLFQLCPAIGISVWFGHIWGAQCSLNSGVLWHAWDHGSGLFLLALHYLKSLIVQLCRNGTVHHMACSPRKYRNLWDHKWFDLVSSRLSGLAVWLHPLWATRSAWQTHNYVACPPGACQALPVLAQCDPI